MEQPYKANVLIVKSVGMLPGASAEYTSLSMNVQPLKKYRLYQFLTHPFEDLLSNAFLFS
ncbi:MAG: hypothetical protein HDS88_07185 [Bacteroidales bacterium]|nr:hypothetical protein [Bacteroidales bacterium]